MEDKLAEPAPKRPLALTIGAAAVTILVIAGVFSAPTVVTCFNSPDGMGQCIRGKFTEAGLFPTPPATVAADVDGTAPAETPAADAAAGEEPATETASAPEADLPPAALDVTPPADVPESLVAATFGLLRAEPDGSVVIAGSGTPGSEVEVYSNGSLLGRATVETSGDWVLVPDAPLPPGGVEITLAEKGKTGAAEQSFVVVIDEDKTSQPLVVASAPGQATEILQGLDRPSSSETTQLAAADPVAQPEAATPADEPAPAAETQAQPAVQSEAPAAETPAAETPVAETPAAEEPAADQPATEAAVATEAPEATTDQTAAAPEASAADTPAAVPATEAPATVTATEAPATVTSAETAPAAEPAEQATETPAEPATAAEEPAAEPTERPAETAVASTDAAEPTEAPGTAPAEPSVAETPSEPSLLPSIDAIEIEGDRTFFAGSGPEGGVVRLYVDDEFVADATVEGGRWLVEAGAVLDEANQRVRADLLAPGSSDVQARAEVDFVVDLPKTETAVANADVPAVEPAPEAAPEAPAPAEQPAAPAAETTPAPETLAPEAPVAEEPAAVADQPVAEPTSESAPAADSSPAATPSQPAAPEPAPSVAAPEASPAPEAPTPEAAPAEPAPAEPAPVEPAPAEAPAVETAPAEPVPAAPAPQETVEPAVPTMVAVSVGGPDAQRFAAGKAIIRRGDNLWTIARRVYGEGIKYTTIYQANTGQIRDPDRIYPGQVFDLPN